jgi:hypothetical protein
MPEARGFSEVPVKKVFDVVDLGVSTTKIISGEGGGSIQYLTQPPGIVPLHPDLYADKLHLASAETVVLKMTDGTCWIVGEGAGKEPADKGDKSRTAIAKIIAAVGQVVTEATLLDLAVMLPANESEGFTDLALELTEELYGAKINGRRLGMTLGQPVQLHPEGSGLASLIDEGILLIFGQKDVSLLPVKGGRVDGTPHCFVGWGMVRLLAELPVPVMDEVTTAHAVFRFLLKKNDRPLRDLFGARADKVIGKMPAVLENYWLGLKRKLSSVSAIADADRIYVGGGNAPIFLPLVDRSFAQKCEAKSLVAHVHEHFPELDKKPLAYRLSDPLALFLKVFS